ncbi:MAG: hypothetical protein MMC33_005587 [Icmadophila ericetorum]|nr:hypothetical protein [Icmadophila ericetorum]
MADEERRSSKRSRFDQTEPEPKRSTRFDRRSRSPISRESESKRSRSPVTKDTPLSPTTTERKKSALDPAAAAAAAAAKINAQIQAKKGIQHVDVPPIRSLASPTGKASSPGASGSSTSNINGDMYIADGDYIKDIEVNDLRNRYTLTKGSTQKMVNTLVIPTDNPRHIIYEVVPRAKDIKEETGADVTTRGSYCPDKSLATAANPPLYLHVTSTTKDGLEKAVAKIEELMKQELPNLVDERRFRRREPEQVERDEFGRRKWPEERIEIGLEPIPGFNLRAQVVGHGGQYVKHIQQETRCRVQIKGRGSGFMEHGTGNESDEPMYLHVAGPDPREVQRAKELCEDLLNNVKEQYERFKENPPPQRGYGSGSYGSGERQGSYGGYGGYGTGYGGAASSAQSPTTPQAPPGTPGAPGAASPTDYSAQYAQYYAGGQDPYAAYGGYQNYVAYYQYYQQQAVQQQQTTAPPGAPPGPPSEPPPPPPPSGSPPTANGGYNAVSLSNGDALTIQLGMRSDGSAGTTSAWNVEWLRRLR